MEKALSMIAVCTFPDWIWPPEWITKRLSDYLLGKAVTAWLFFIAAGGLSGLAALVTGAFRFTLVGFAAASIIIAIAPLIFEHLRPY